METNKIETFIFVHEQNIIIEFEKNNKYKDIGKYTYVFLGYGETILLREFKNIIIVRDLPINMEDFPKMCAFSGWYALVKNFLIKSEYINLIEYDTILSDSFIDIILNNINNGEQVIGFKPYDINICFLGNKYWSGGIENYYNNLVDRVVNICSEKKIKEWSTTSNVTVRKDFLIKYIEDNENLFEFLKYYDSVGHELERNLSIYCFFNNIDIKYIPDLVVHFQLDSHKTQGLFNDNYYNNMINKISGI